jgi:hypothetical protein
VPPQSRHRPGRRRRAVRRGRGHRAGVLLEPITRREPYLSAAAAALADCSHRSSVAPLRGAGIRRGVGCGGRAVPGRSLPARLRSLASRAFGRFRPPASLRVGGRVGVTTEPLGWRGRPSPAVGHAGSRRARPCRAGASARGRVRSAEPTPTGPSARLEALCPGQFDRAALGRHAAPGGGRCGDPGPQDSGVGTRRGRSRRGRACPRVGDGRPRHPGVGSAPNPATTPTGRIDATRVAGRATGPELIACRPVLTRRAHESRTAATAPGRPPAGSSNRPPPGPARRL